MATEISERVWLKRMLEELLIYYNGEVKIMCENKVVIRFFENIFFIIK